MFECLIKFVKDRFDHQDPIIDIKIKLALRIRYYLLKSEQVLSTFTASEHRSIWFSMLKDWYHVRPCLAHQVLFLQVVMFECLIKLFEVVIKMLSCCDDRY